MAGNSRSSFSTFLGVGGMIVSLLIPSETEARFRALFRNALRSIMRYDFTIVIPERERLSLNYMYGACDVYLSTKISKLTRAVKVNKAHPDEDELAVTVGTDQDDEVIRDTHAGIRFTWVRTKGYHRRCFQLSVDRAHMDHALKVYLPYICRKAKEMKTEMKATVRLHTVVDNDNDDDEDEKQRRRRRSCWTSAVVKHPSTIATMAMDPAVKAELVRDMDLFVSGKDYYTRAGRAWKRGYLFYGPPGTGKSSLVAAMANYLKFDIFDLDLKAVRSNSHLRSLLLSATNRSILVIEDIDISSTIPLHRDRETSASTSTSTSTSHGHHQMTLSGLLNLIDGLWSCCGEERIIVFTTNHKERLDPALLRPGRMDVHLEMSYCTFPAIKMLASNYLQVSVDDHPLFPEIEKLLAKFPATPAQIAGVFMNNRLDADAALLSLFRLLKEQDNGTTVN